MGYRPITDTWFLARAKLKGGVKYYGAYLGGFPERARALLGVNTKNIKVLLPLKVRKLLYKNIFPTVQAESRDTINKLPSLEKVPTALLR